MAVRIALHPFFSETIVSAVSCLEDLFKTTQSLLGKYTRCHELMSEGYQNGMKQAPIRLFQDGYLSVNIIVI